MQKSKMLPPPHLLLTSHSQGPLWQMNLASFKTCTYVPCLQLLSFSTPVACLQWRQTHIVAVLQLLSAPSDLSDFLTHVSTCTTWVVSQEWLMLHQIISRSVMLWRNVQWVVSYQNEAEQVSTCCGIQDMKWFSWTGWNKCRVWCCKINLSALGPNAQHSV